jgi:hypothetical protein
MLQTCVLYGPANMSRMKWRKTKVQFLLLDEHSGRYYCRLYADGKQHWKSLETDVFSVAKARLAEHMKDFRSAVKTDQTVDLGKATVEQLSKAYLDGVRKQVGIDMKPSTAHYREQLGAWIFTVLDRSVLLVTVLKFILPLSVLVNCDPPVKFV